MSALQIDGHDVTQTIELPFIYDGWSIAITDDGRTWNRWGKLDYPGRYNATREWMELNQMKDAGDAKEDDR
jgi:hypothetical protein